MPRNGGFSFFSLILSLQIREIQVKRKGLLKETLHFATLGWAWVAFASRAVRAAEVLLSPPAVRTALVTLTHSLWDTDRQISFIYYTFGRDTCATLSLHPNFNMELRVLTRAFFPDGNLPELSSRQLFFQRGSISFKLTTKRCERVPASCLFIYFLPPPIAFQMTYFCFPLETN